MVLVLSPHLLSTNGPEYLMAVCMCSYGYQVDHVMELIEGFGLLLQAAVTLFIFARF